MPLDNDIFWGVLTFVIMTIISSFFFWLRKEAVNNGVNPNVSDPVINALEEKAKVEVQEIIEEIKPKRKVGRPKKALLLFLVFMPFLASCSVITGFLSSEADKIHISYDNKENSKAIDSLFIDNKPIYFEVELNSLLDGQDYDLNKPNGTIWLLRTGNKLRVEVTPKDTLIKIYRK